MGLWGTKPSWKRGCILKLRETSMERKAVAKLWRAVAVTHSNTNCDRGEPFFLSRMKHDKMDVLGRMVWCLCYRHSQEPGQAPEHSNKCSLKSKQIIITIHLGFMPLCYAQITLSKIWDNNGTIVGKLKYIMKASETRTAFQHSNVSALICIDSSFKYN